MKIIDGYVCIAFYKELDVIMEIPFGRRTNKTLKQCFENIASNGMVLFESKNQAKRARKHILERRFIEKVEIAHLKMEIIETEEELDLPKFTKSKSLIVISIGDNLLFVGRSVEGKPHLYPLPGSPLYFNGNLPIEDFEHAKYVCAEYIRQGGCPARIATFELTRFP